MTSPLHPAPDGLPRPFFVAESGPRLPRRLLLLSYHFPPSTAAGGLRWESMLRYAAERGWQADVVTLDPRHLSASGREGLLKLPAGTRVFGVDAAPLGIDRIEQAVRRVRRWLSRPRPSPADTVSPAAGEGTAAGFFRAAEVRRLPRSARQMSRAYFAWKEIAEQRSWRDAMIQLGAGLARSESYDAIITCGPPHLVHTAGASLSSRTGIPLVIDFRDPWSLQQVLPDYRASQRWYDLASRHEAEAVRQASLIVMNTEPCRDAMRSRYAEAAGRIIAVTNGYDEQEALPAPAPDGRFLILYAGTLYFVYEHPRPFFDAVSRLVREFSLTPAQLAIEFIGDAGGYNGTPTSDIAAQSGIGDFFQSLPFVPRREIFSHLARATVMVSLAQLNDLAIPSKLFDYMRFHAWILAIAAPGSATEVVLRGTGADLVPENDSELIYQALRERFLQFRRGESPAPIAPATRSSRREQAGLLFDALEPRLHSVSGFSPRSD